MMGVIYGGRFLVWASGLCYCGAMILGFCSIHYTVTLPGMKIVVHYTRDFIIFRGSLHQVPLYTLGVQWLKVSISPTDSKFRATRYNIINKTTAKHCSIDLNS